MRARERRPTSAGPALPPKTPHALASPEADAELPEPVRGADSGEEAKAEVAEQFFVYVFVLRN